MATDGEKPASATPLRAVLLTGVLGLSWCGLLAYLVLVVPQHEKAFIEHRMRIPPSTEWAIAISRWCVKYWYVAIWVAGVLCLLAGAVMLANRRSFGWKTWCAWLLLTALPLFGVAVAWQVVAQVPVPFREVPKGEIHADARAAALAANPAIEKGWRVHFAKLGFEDVVLDQYLIRVDPLWDQDQQIRPEVSKVFCDRLALLDAATLADWENEFGKATELGKPGPASVASLLIQHDRLFAGGALNQDEARLLKQRLRVLPQAAFKQWEELGMDGKVETMPFVSLYFGDNVAMDLIRRDELFLNGAWQAGTFQALCDRARSRTK
jgi:hypothetical protein